MNRATLKPRQTVAGKGAPNTLHTRQRLLVQTGLVVVAVGVFILVSFLVFSLNLHETNVRGMIKILAGIVCASGWFIVITPVFTFLSRRLKPNFVVAAAVALCLYGPGVLFTGTIAENSLFLLGYKTTPAKVDSVAYYDCRKDILPTRRGTSSWVECNYTPVSRRILDDSYDVVSDSFQIEKIGLTYQAGDAVASTSIIVNTSDTEVFTFPGETINVQYLKLNPELLRLNDGE